MKNMPDKNRYHYLITNFITNYIKSGYVSVFMRDTSGDVDFIIAIDKDLYFDDNKCKPLYDKSAEITRQNIHISISFMPCGSYDSIHSDRLKADGYVEIQVKRNKITFSRLTEEERKKIRLDAYDYIV